VRFGLHLPQLGRAASPDRVASVAVRAEQLGFDDVWASDHVAVPTAMEGMPSFFPEPIPLLSIAAAHTRRVGLGTSVIVPAYRNPMHFAKQWATLDWAAPGRTILGVGAGWLADEFAAVGVSMTARGPRLDDYIRGWRALWSGETEFESRFFSFTGVRVNPRPAGTVPIWIGGSSAGAMSRAAWCDGWHGTWAPLDEFARRVATLQGEVERLGRDPADVTVSIHMEVTLGDGLAYSGWSKVGDGYGDRRPVTGSPREVAGLVLDYAAAGLDHVLVTPVARGAEAWDEMVEGLAEMKQIVEEEI
jgi:probable F420-dependent oxidoreductase